MVPLLALEQRPNDAILANIRTFAAECEGRRTTQRAYATWSGRLVSLSTVEHRFGSWGKALTLAHQPLVPREFYQRSSALANVPVG